MGLGDIREGAVGGSLRVDASVGGHVARELGVSMIVYKCRECISRMSMKSCLYSQHLYLRLCIVTVYHCPRVCLQNLYRQIFAGVEADCASKVSADEGGTSSSVYYTVHA